MVIRTEILFYHLVTKTDIDEYVVCSHQTMMLSGILGMKLYLFHIFQADTTQVFSELSEKLLGIPSTEGTNMPASFDHLATGYDAQFYSYLVC